MVVNAGAAGLSKATSDGPISLDVFSEFVATNGKERKQVRAFAALHGIDPTVPVKHFEVDTHLNLVKICQFVMGPGGDKRPLGLLFIDNRSDEFEVIGYSYWASPQGELISSFIRKGKYDVNGKPIRDSAVDTNLDISDPRTQRMFKAELEFWLNGTYKKFLPAPATTEKPEKGSPAPK